MFPHLLPQYSVLWCLVYPLFFRGNIFSEKTYWHKIHSCSHDYLKQKAFISTQSQCAFDKMDSKIFMSSQKTLLKSGAFYLMLKSTSSCLSFKLQGKLLGQTTQAGFKEEIDQRFRVFSPTTITWPPSSKAAAVNCSAGRKLLAFHGESLWWPRHCPLMTFTLFCTVLPTVLCKILYLAITGFTLNESIPFFFSLKRTTCVPQAPKFILVFLWNFQIGLPASHVPKSYW